MTRTHIGFFGRRNAGKSTLANAITGQAMSVVSPTPGTTTDPVRKTMELLPIGPVMIIDTPGFDDDGDLGELRVATARKILREVDIAVLVVDVNIGMGTVEEELISLFGDTPYLIAKTHCELDIETLKQQIATLAAQKKEPALLADLVKPGDVVVLVAPIDESAPKDRMILPQSHAIRDILDAHAICVVAQVDELAHVLANLANSPALVITDSQVFRQVATIVPQDVPLTSFSILFARYKGFLRSAVAGIEALAELPTGANILIAEGCTHHRQCDDIGTVKLPHMIEQKLGRTFDFEFCAGHAFPEDLSAFSLVLHCGGCMLNAKAVQTRRDLALARGVPFTNYGVAIAWLTGILERCLLDGTLR